MTMILSDVIEKNIFLVKIIKSVMCVNYNKFNILTFNFPYVQHVLECVVSTTKLPIYLTILLQFIYSTSSYPCVLEY